MRPIQESLPWCSILLLLVITMACQPTSEQGHAPVSIKVSGALRTIMKEGNLAATIALDSLADTPHRYGLGAAANLKGEILIWDGQPYRSFVQQDTGLATDSGWQQAAALLVYTEVANWTPVPLPDSVSTPYTLEHFLATLSTQPFPFLLQGQFSSLSWHIIDWPAGDSVHTHAKHRQAGLHGTQEDQKWEVLGFYSSQHHGIFTHHSTNLHMHAKAAAPAMVAHVDDCMLSPEVTLWVPQGL